MTGIWVVATNTLRQTIRRRLFFNIAVFGVGMVLLSMVVGNITFGFPDRVVRSIGLSGVAIAVDLMALLVAVALIHEEIDRKTLFVVLTRPLERWQYLLGRYLGLLFAIALALAGFCLIFALTLSVVGGTFSPRDMAALAVVFPEAAVLGAFGLLLSTFTSPTMASGLGLGFWLAAATVDDLFNLSRTAEGFTKTLADVIGYVLPNLARFDLRGVAIHGGEVAAMEVVQLFGYAGFYVAAFLLIASVVLTRRDMV